VNVLSVVQTFELVHPWMVTDGLVTGAVNVKVNVALVEEIAFVTVMDWPDE
jgi:hypothetical protein